MRELSRVDWRGDDGSLIVLERDIQAPARYPLVVPKNGIVCQINVWNGMHEQ